jgi:SAM-dependent methyltransferase
VTRVTNAKSAGQLSRLWNTARLLPRIAWVASRAPRNPHRAWERYWSGIRRTGAGGEVLWDSASEAEREQYAAAIRAHLDTTLPVIDVGCGNGSFTRWLAGFFPSVVGTDVSPSAIRRAELEAVGLPNVSFAVADATAPGEGARLAGLVGGRCAAGGADGAAAHVFVRGVLHVLPPKGRAAMAANLLSVVGGNGRVLLTETNFTGSPLQYVQWLGAVPGYIPAGLRRAIAGLPMPGRFGAAERQAAFPEDQWELLADGPAVIQTVPAESADFTEIPGYFAVLRPRTGS